MSKMLMQTEAHAHGVGGKDRKFACPLERHVRASCRVFPDKKRRKSCSLPNLGGKPINGGSSACLRPEIPLGFDGRGKGARRNSMSQCVEAKLYRLLKRLTPMLRRRLLSEQFTEPQRLALERWIHAHRASRRSPVAGAAGQKTQRKARNSDATCAGISSTVAHFSGIPGEPGSKCLRSECGSSTGGKQASTVAASAGARSKSGIYGIQCRSCPGRHLYRAKVIVGPFHLISEYHCDLAEAQRRLDVLLRVRGNVGGSLDSGDSIRVLEGRFREAVAKEALRAAADDSPEWRFQFFGNVPAKFWVGRSLNTPCFLLAVGRDSGASRGLEAGLHAWRRLRDARGLVMRGNRYTMARHCSSKELVAAWARLRQVYIDVWAEAGRCPQKTRARLSRLEAKCATRIQAWSLPPISCSKLAFAESSSQSQVASRLAARTSKVETSNGSWTASGAECRIQDLVLRWKCRGE